LKRLIIACENMVKTKKQTPANKFVDMTFQKYVDTANAKLVELEEYKQQHEEKNLLSEDFDVTVPSSDALKEYKKKLSMVTDLYSNTKPAQSNSEPSPIIHNRKVQRPVVEEPKKEVNVEEDDNDKPPQKTKEKLDSKKRKIKELTPEELLAKNRQDQDQIAGEMIHLAQGLKQIHLNARDTIRADNAKIDKLEKNITDNTTDTKQRVGGLVDLLKSSRSSTFCYWLIIVFATLSFWFMFVFIKLFSK